MFNLHANNLLLLKAVIRKKGAGWIHGDGNVFTEEQASKFRRKYSNPRQEDATYWKKYDDIDDVPDTIAELEEELLKAKNAEKKEEAKQNLGKDVETYDIGPTGEELSGAAGEDLDSKGADLLRFEQHLNAKGESLSAKEQELQDRENKLKDQAERLAGIEKDLKKKTAAKSGAGAEEGL